MKKKDLANKRERTLLVCQKEKKTVMHSVIHSSL